MGSLGEPIRCSVSILDGHDSHRVLTEMDRSDDDKVFGSATDGLLRRYLDEQVHRRWHTQNVHGLSQHGPGGKCEALSIGHSRIHIVRGCCGKYEVQSSVFWGSGIGYHHLYLVHHHCSGHSEWRDWWRVSVGTQMVQRHELKQQ